MIEQNVSSVISDTISLKTEHIAANRTSATFAMNLINA